VLEIPVTRVKRVCGDNMIDYNMGIEPMVPCDDADGLKKQVILLQEISDELDNYFARQIM